LEKENTLHLLFSLSTHSVDCDTKSHLQDPLNTTFFTTPKLHLWQKHRYLHWLCLVVFY